MFNYIKYILWKAVLKYRIILYSLKIIIYFFKSQFLVC